VRKAGGVVVRAKAEVEQPLTDALRALSPSLSLTESKEIPRVQRVNGQGGNNGGNTGGNNEEIG
jgi:hypothetical protein